MTENAAWTIPSSASKVSDLTKLSRAIPTPGPGQVLVKLTAASLNFRDLLIATRSPDYPGLHKDDLVSGSDGAGIIWSAGPFSKWLGREKAKVMVHNCSWITGDSRNWDFDKVLGGVVTDGTLQQYIVMDDELVIVAPSNLSTVETASLSTAGVTAWGAIRASLDMGLDGALEKWPTSTSLSFLEGNSPATPVTTNTTWTAKRLTGLTVLTMGTGGVSCFAIQIASTLGATVIATSSSASKLNFAKSLGATHVINYAETPDWDQEVLKLTDGKGVDHVIECGGAGTLMKSIASTRVGGLITLLGVLTPNDKIPAEFIPSILFGAKIIRGTAGFSRDAVIEFVQFVEANNIKPVIAQEFAFDDVVQAFEALQQQKAVGKIVVKVADEYGAETGDEWTAGSDI